MGTCLGIYLGDKLIKYAKLIRDEKSKRISLVSCGTKYIVGNKDIEVAEIINQTGSAEDAIAVNLRDYHKLKAEVFKQLGKADTQSVIDLEVGDHATSLSLNERNVEYRYIFTESLVSNDNRTAEIIITDKANIKKHIDGDVYSNCEGLYPQEYILPNLIKASSASLIVNIDEKTQIISVESGEVKQTIDIEVSMKDILDRIAEQEGSYSKACDVCKGINVLSDENISPEIENIIEPVIQDLLNRIKAKLDEAKIKYDRIYLSGLINLFINIDVLFEQFFGITTEKLRPHFLKLEETANISEVIEAADAVALAYCGLEDRDSELNFMSGKSGAKKSKGLSKNKGDKKLDSDNKKVRVLPNINVEAIEKALFFANLTAGVILTGYVGFSTVYNAKLTSMEKSLSEKINAIQQETTKIKEDSNYISTNTRKYTTFNNYISDTVEKIRAGTIGKYTTYNVANFMQKIAKYIPTNVQLVSISSDDNKKVSIVAKSTSYAELGYFISQLKLKGILENIKTDKVENEQTTASTENKQDTEKVENQVSAGKAASITVTIGGDLP